MKTKIFSIMAAAVAMLGLSSCGDDNWTPAVEKQGSVSLMSMKVEVQSGEDVISRAAVNVDNFTVEIYNSKEELVNKWTYSTMPEILTLPVANDYTLKVYSHQVQKAQWDAPYYCGEKKFDIESNKITNIGTITCTFQSVRVSVRFTDTLLAVMADDCNVNVIVNDEGSLDFTKDETRSGYFEYIPESMTMVATFTGTVAGNEEYLRKSFTDLAAGQHRIITFDIKGNGATPPTEYGNIDGGGSGVSINMSVEDVDINGNVVTDEDIVENPSERPGQEEPEDPGTDPGTDPGNDPQPSGNITFTPSSDISFDPANPTPTTGSDYQVQIHSDNPIAHINVKINSSSTFFMSAVADMVPLEFDLCYPDGKDANGEPISGENSEKFSNLGFPVGNEVIGATDVPFNITPFMGLLAQPAFAGNHEFSLEVVDNAGNKKGETIYLFTNK